jgi:hypothetical protein
MRDRLPNRRVETETRRPLHESARRYLYLERPAMVTRGMPSSPCSRGRCEGVGILHLKSLEAGDDPSKINSW